MRRLSEIHRYDKGRRSTSRARRCRFQRDQYLGLRARLPGHWETFLQFVNVLGEVLRPARRKSQTANEPVQGRGCTENTDKGINRSGERSRLGFVANSAVAAQRLVELARSSLGLGEEAAYLLCSIAVQAAIYSALDLLAIRGQSRSDIPEPFVSDGCAATCRCRFGSDDSFVASWARASLDQRRRSGRCLHSRSRSRAWCSLSSLEDRNLRRGLCYWRCDVAIFAGG